MLNARIKILADHDGQATDRIEAEVRSTTSLHHDDQSTCRYFDFQGRHDENC